MDVAPVTHASGRWRTVLPIGLERATLERLGEALAPLEAVVTAPAGDWEEAADLTAAGRYDALVVGFPLQGGPISRLLSLVRRVECPCHDSAVVLLAPDRYRLEAEGSIGRGANRVVSLEEMEVVLAEVLERLFAIAPRVEVHVPSRIEVPSTEFSRRAYCQTVNISASGMLLRAPRSYRPGTELAFEMLIPTEAAPLRGRAMVVRASVEGREPYPTIGVSFASFELEGAQRLANFLRGLAG